MTAKTPELLPFTHGINDDHCRACGAVLYVGCKECYAKETAQLRARVSELETDLRDMERAKTAYEMGCKVAETQRDERERERDRLSENYAKAIDILDGNEETIDPFDKNYPELLRKLSEHLNAMQDKAKLRRERDAANEALRVAREALQKWRGHFMWRQSPDDDGMHSIPTKIIQDCLEVTRAALAASGEEKP